MNILLNTDDHPFAFQDGMRPEKILAGDRVFELLAPQRTSIIFGIRDVPWAAAAYRIHDLIVQLEPNLNEWDAIAIEVSGNARLVRHNTVVYELECSIPRHEGGSFLEYTAYSLMGRANGVDGWTSENRGAMGREFRCNATPRHGADSR